MAVRIWATWLGAGLLLLGALCFLSESRLPLQAEVETIRLYQRFGSPLVSYLVKCRFELTCSRYALETLQKKGFGPGNLRILQRLAFCSPLGYLI